ncbi:MAG TPA: aminopeptidase [Planctomycetota bacterium]|nr:aminopeptidase [Planctomycetota bacterium]
MTAPTASNGTDLREVHFDPELLPGARNAAFTCLAIRPGERTVLVTDREALQIGAALADQFRAAGADLRAFVLEDVATRPLRALPTPIASAMEDASVSCYAAGAQEGELRARIEMTEIVNRRRIRHGHMVTITPRIMVEGMRADFGKVDALSSWVLERARHARTLTAWTPAGTRITASFDPAIRWLKTSGIISPEKWGNLPGGEVLTSPARVDGTFVVDGVLGDWLSHRYGDISATPLTIEIENSRIVGARCARHEILRDFMTYVAADENGNRVGELALGTNLAVRDVIGHMLQDEKIPGLHLAFGHPYTEHTGASWRATTHIDVVARHFDVDIDGTPLMRDSRYLTGAELAA